jgi:hypothetical protein
VLHSARGNLEYLGGAIAFLDGRELRGRLESFTRLTKGVQNIVNRKDLKIVARHAASESDVRTRDLLLRDFPFRFRKRQVEAHRLFSAESPNLSAGGIAR